MNKTLQKMNSVIYKTGKNYLDAVSIVATSKCYDHAVKFVSEILADNNKTDVNIIVKCALEDVEKFYSNATPQIIDQILLGVYKCMAWTKEDQASVAEQFPEQ